jgi:Protein of unknown function DUF72
MPAHQRVRTRAARPRHRRLAAPGPHRLPATCLIGCSGWQYKHWRGDFYPASLAQNRWLPFYAEQFNTVEINNTFYRLPETATFEAWRQHVRRGFVFAVKASRYLHVLEEAEGP